MKASYPLLFVIALATSAIAQDSAKPKENGGISDVVLKAIEEFNRRKNAGKSEENEVVVVLDPPAPIDAPVENEIAEEPEVSAEIENSDVETEDTKPSLITEAPTETTEPEVLPEELESTAPEIVADTTAETPTPEIPSEPELEIRVESIRKGSGLIDPSQVKLKASFPAKPLSSPPEGWVLEKSEQAPVFRKDVELQPGTSITLSIKPHILTPGSDGINNFSVVEPGFEASQGYHQKNTVSAILSTSVAQLDNHSLQLGNAISELHRLLASLPKPEPQPEDIAKPTKP